MNTQSDKWVIAGVATTTGTVLLADLLTPLGIAVPMLYVCPLSLTWFAPGSRITTVITGSSFVLIILGLVFSSGEITSPSRWTGCLPRDCSLLLPPLGCSKAIGASDYRGTTGQE